MAVCRACVPLFLPSLLTAQLDELAIIREEAVQHVQYVAVFYRQMQVDILQVVSTVQLHAVLSHQDAKCLHVI